MGSMVQQAVAATVPPGIDTGGASLAVTTPTLHDTMNGVDTLTPGATGILEVTTAAVSTVGGPVGCETLNEMAAHDATRTLAPEASVVHPSDAVVLIMQIQLGAGWFCNNTVGTAGDRRGYRNGRQP